MIADILEAHEGGFLDGEETREFISELAEAFTRKAVAEAMIVSDLAFGPHDDETCDDCRRENEAAQTDPLH